MYELKAGEHVKDGKLHGWTGIICAPCKGTGEREDHMGGRRACTGCGGTGEAHGVMPIQPRELPSDTE